MLTRLLYTRWRTRLPRSSGPNRHLVRYLSIPTDSGCNCQFSAGSWAPLMARSDEAMVGRNASSDFDRYDQCLRARISWNLPRYGIHQAGCILHRLFVACSSVPDSCPQLLAIVSLSSQHPPIIRLELILRSRPAQRSSSTLGHGQPPKLGTPRETACTNVKLNSR